MTESAIRRIYVGLLDRRNDGWRQVEAVPEGGDVYRIVSRNDCPEERWEYGLGDKVHCLEAVLPSGERAIVATQRVESAEKGPASVQR